MQSFGIDAPWTRHFAQQTCKVRSAASISRPNSETVPRKFTDTSTRNTSGPRKHQDTLNARDHEHVLPLCAIMKRTDLLGSFFLSKLQRYIFQWLGDGRRARGIESTARERSQFQSMQLLRVLGLC